MILIISYRKKPSPNMFDMCFQKTSVKKKKKKLVNAQIKSGWKWKSILFQTPGNSSFFAEVRIRTFHFGTKN